VRACDHFHKGPPTVHGGPPGTTKFRHTGDLGNVSAGTYTYHLEGLKVSELFGRSVIVHADPDGRLGNAADSATTGHSGKRIACALLGRAEC
jgi:Cu/Zn superoxide dismutase